jgi:hypothetical protein
MACIELPPYKTSKHLKVGVTKTHVFDPLVSIVDPY